MFFDNLVRGCVCLLSRCARVAGQDFHLLEQQTFHDAHGPAQYLTIWRRTVLIPWNEFKGIGQTMLYWQKVPVLTVGDPPVATITIQNDVFAAMRGRVEA
jgi:hypothetical protein